MADWRYDRSLMSRGSIFEDDPGTVPPPLFVALEEEDDEEDVMVGASETRRFLAGDGARFGCGVSPALAPCWRMAPPIDLRIAGGRDEL